MNTPTLRLQLFPAALAVIFPALTLPCGFASPPAADSAFRLLQTRGSLEVNQAGPYVAPGTFRVQVAAKLGRADATLPDGTWLYHDHQIEQSEARGTLVVRFGTDGRVSSLRLVTPAMAAALRGESRQTWSSPLLVKR